MINRVIIDCGLLQQRKLSTDVICTQGPPLKRWILCCLLLRPPQRQEETALLSKAVRIFGSLFMHVLTMRGSCLD